MFFAMINLSTRKQILGSMYATKTYLPFPTITNGLLRQISFYVCTLIFCCRYCFNVCYDFLCAFIVFTMYVFKEMCFAINDKINKILLSSFRKGSPIYPTAASITVLRIHCTQRQTPSGSQTWDEGYRESSSRFHACFPNTNQ